MPIRRFWIEDPIRPDSIPGIKYSRTACSSRRCEKSEILNSKSEKIQNSKFKNGFEFGISNFGFFRISSLGFRISRPGSLVKQNLLRVQHCPKYVFIRGLSVLRALANVLQGSVQLRFGRRVGKGPEEELFDFFLVGGRALGHCD